MLTELQVKSAKAQGKSYMIRDDRGLYLRVDASGRKYWILRFWERGKEHQKSLGPYPDISLRDARLRRDEIQTARAKGESPSTVQAPRLFSETVEEWIKVRMGDKSEKYMRGIHNRLRKYILPVFGEVPIRDITSGEILRLCRKVESLGYLETAHRVKVLMGQVFRFAIASGEIDTDPTAALAGALRPQNVQHMATFSRPEDIARLMAAILEYPYGIMRCALLFSVYTFARPGEVRAAEWAEIRGDLWDIPSGKMKMKRRHLVPLSTQALAVIEELRPITGRGRYLFPSPRNDGRCMSENGVRVALRAMGFTNEEITPHGFRAMLSTVANEHGWNRDVIERQLAHVSGDTVRAAYNHAEYLPERRRLMQWWANWLGSLINTREN